MLNKLFFCVLILCVSCQQPSKEIITDSCKVNGFTFKLIQNGEVSKLDISPNNFTLEGNLGLQPPCYFMRKNDTIQKYSYPDVNADEVLMIVGNMADDQRKETFGVPKKEVCGTIAQGLILQGNKIILSTKTLTGAIVCKDLGLDEKNFWGFAH